MPDKIDKKIIQKNFSRGAKKYNDVALIQKEAAKKLCELAFKSNPSRDNVEKILDLGSGTSFVAKNFSDKKNLQIFEVDLSLEMLKSWSHRPSNVFAINADFEKLPFKHSSFDLIISSFSLQWMNDFEKNFSNFFSLLKPQGILAFCLPTNESLSELKSANIFNFNELPKVDDLKLALKKAGFVEQFFVTEIAKQSFPNGLQALRSMKEIGANSSVKNNKIITKSELKQFDNFCLKNFSTSAKNIHTSWFISYFILSK